MNHLKKDLMKERVWAPRNPGFPGWVEKGRKWRRARRVWRGRRKTRRNQCCGGWETSVWRRSGRPCGMWPQAARRQWGSGRGRSSVAMGRNQLGMDRCVNGLGEEWKPERQRLCAEGQLRWSVEKLGVAVGRHGSREDPLLLNILLWKLSNLQKV